MINIIKTLLCYCDATVMCSYCPTIVKDNISSLLYSVDKYSNRTYTNGRDTTDHPTTITNNMVLMI